MAPGGLRSMLAIDCSWKKTAKYATSAASAVHEPLSSPVTEVILDSWDHHDWQGSSDALTDWLNERWKKTGFQISKEVVCFTLKYHGRKAEMGRGDHLGGTFSR
jgi:amidase